MKPFYVITQWTSFTNLMTKEEFEEVYEKRFPTLQTGVMKKFHHAKITSVLIFGRLFKPDSALRANIAKILSVIHFKLYEKFSILPKLPPNLQYKSVEKRDMKNCSLIFKI